MNWRSVKHNARLLFLLALLLSVLSSSPEITDCGTFLAQSDGIGDIQSATAALQERESLDKSNSSENENFEESLPQRSQNPTRADNREQLEQICLHQDNFILGKIARLSTPFNNQTELVSTVPRWLMLRTLLI